MMNKQNENRAKPDKPKPKRGRAPKLVLQIDAKPEDIAWAVTNTTPKDLGGWEARDKGRG